MGESFFVWGVEDVKDLVELVDIVMIFEEGVVIKEFSKNIINRLYVN